MPGHEDERLPHKEKEQAAKEGQHQNQCAEQEQAGAENAVDHILPVKAGKETIHGNVLGNQIERHPYYLRGQHTENI